MQVTVRLSAGGVRLILVEDDSWALQKNCRNGAAPPCHQQIASLGRAVGTMVFGAGRWQRSIRL
jgi:hypothetical protein